MLVLKKWAKMMKKMGVAKIAKKSNIMQKMGWPWAEIGVGAKSQK